MMKGKRLLSLLLCVLIAVGSVAAGGDVISIKTNAEETTDYKVGDIVEFGTYPQSLVADSSLISAIDSLDGEWVSYNYYSGTGYISDGNMASSTFMRYKDVSYNGEKYRGVIFDLYRPNVTGYSFSAEQSSQDDNGYTNGNIYWFRYEPIKWRVLDPETGLIMCDTAIDSQAFNNYFYYDGSEYYGDHDCNYYASNYAMSSIRAWLNDDFYNTAFSTEQKADIFETELDNSSTDSTVYDAPSTTDKVFLLSYSEVFDSNYGFDSTARQMKCTEYAKCQGCWQCPENSYAGNVIWWTRSPRDSYSSRDILYTGSGNYGSSVNYTDEGVVPALRLNLKLVLITGDMIEPIAAKTYTAGRVIPDITIKDGDKTLVEGSDYTVSVKNNVKAGTAEVTVTGIGKYTGSVTADFEIEPLEIAVSWSDEPLYYDGTMQMPVVTFSNKIEGDDVNLVVSGAEMNAGENYTASVTALTGADRSNYKLPEAPLSKTFNIFPASQKAPTGVSKTDETKCSANDGTVTGVTAEMEIAYERGEFKPCKATEITGLQPGTYSVRYAADGNHNASDTVQLIIGKGACYGGEATCLAPAKCEACGNEYSRPDPDNHHCTRKSDGTGHWMECDCGYTESTEAHKDSDNDLKCDVCGYELAEVTQIAEFPSIAGIPYGKSISMKAESAYGKIIYTSSNPEVASVNEDGEVKANYRGECVITAQVEGTDIKSECTVKVGMTLWQRIQYIFAKILGCIISALSFDR